jgi:RNA polymerase sigma-70 factor (ECF subfamily)
MLRAWRARGSFVAGTSLKAWTFTILRNQFYSLKRRSWRQAPLTEGIAARCTATSNPDALIELGELQRALTRLPVDLREALILVGAGGFSYGDAAAICGCPVGTIKSRVNRARRALEDVIAAGPPSARGEAPASQALDAILHDVRRISGGSDG